MNDLIIYLLKVTAGTILLYLCFLLFFLKDTFYLRNRIILILSLVLPLLIPLIRITSIVGNRESAVSAIPVTVINSAISAGNTLSGEIKSLDYNGLLITIWLTIAGLLILRTIAGLIKTASIINRGILLPDKFPKLVLSDLNYPPFSFYPFAVIPRRLFIAGDADDIIAHENAHIRQGHSFDLLFSELFTSVFWFNPASWLIKKAVVANHEYLADQDLIRRSVNIKDYQYRLLNLPKEQNQIQFAHSFNNLTKKRIVMINTKSTKSYANLKNLFLVPVVALIFAAFSLKAVLPQEQTASQKSPFSEDSKNQITKLLRNSLKYPFFAQQMDVKGKVYVELSMNKGGKIKEINAFDQIDKVKSPSAIKVIVLGFGIKDKNGQVPQKPVVNDDNMKLAQTMLIEESRRVAKKIEGLDLPECKEKDLNFACEFDFRIESEQPVVIKK